MSHYAQGAAKERAVQKKLEAKGYTVIRGAGSKGADLVAGKADRPTLLVEVKATKAGPFSGLGPADRKAIREAADRAGWTPVLYWWPPGKPDAVVVPEVSWPD